MNSAMNTVAPSLPPRHAVPRLLRAHPLVGFFTLAFGFSWLDIALLGTLGAPAGLVIGIATLGPSVAAVTMTALLDGRDGVRALRGRFRAWRVGARWYLVALLGIPAVYVAATILWPAARADVHLESPVELLVRYLAVFLAGGIIGGPLFEEPGWRGFALPRLQDRWNPTVASLLLGVLWGAWHLPQYLVPGWAAQNGALRATSVLVFLATVLAFTVVMTWIYNHTGGSLLLVVLAHASLNTTQVALVNEIFPRMTETETNALLGFAITALALIVITRGHLGRTELPDAAAGDHAPFVPGSIRG
jgi:uncharacterized protein